MTEITSVLVANRGEIARRVFATCRRRGIATVAVYSDADAASPHVTEADMAVRLPGVTPAETYLRGDLLIAAAQRAGADAIHPGYGFLSESAEFATAVGAAGLTWIGPEPAAIAAMGSKVESKNLMAQAGVPVLDQLAPQSITAAELPVLVKASAGGGGRGMRIVNHVDELAEAIASASREAASAFGDPTVFCERYLASGHHIEVQIMADGHGTVWALGERECSLQRRHQKVIEEAPSPLVERLGPQLRERLLAAARAAATAVDYRGAGTVEFLADPSGAFWFLEMNTRLQVEHPVTECVTGLDLVGLQFDIAAGLPLSGPEPQMTGHAIEARLYAEDPAHDWQPQSGTLQVLDISGVGAHFFVPSRPAIRLDSGVHDGSEIGVHYDPMLAKVIAHAATRPEAAHTLARALQHANILGLTTNRDLLVASLRHPDFLSGTADTGFYTAHEAVELIRQGELDPRRGAVVAALADAAAEREFATVLAGLPSGFRNVPSQGQRRAYTVRDEEFVVDYRFGRHGNELVWLVDSPTGADVTPDFEVVSVRPDQVAIVTDGVRRHYSVARCEGRGGLPGQVSVTGAEGRITMTVRPRFVDPSTQVQAGAMVAPMPGMVVRVAVAAGTRVEAGAPLLWLEAMKMEHLVSANVAGIVTDLPVVVGQHVEQGTTVAIIAAETSEQE